MEGWVLGLIVAVAAMLVAVVLLAGLHTRQANLPPPERRTGGLGDGDAWILLKKQSHA
ncbi:MAG: hypothetical protein QW514_07085 [Thermoprotei archaeon]